MRAGARRWLAIAVLLSAGRAGALDWPQEVTADEGTIVVYRPQPESLAGNALKGRAAMSLELQNSDEPIFGAFWFDARIETDKQGGTALIRDVKVTNVRWPDSKDAEEQRFSAIVSDAVPETGFEISMEALSASLETVQVEQRSLDDKRGANRQMARPQTMRAPMRRR